MLPFSIFRSTTELLGLLLHPSIIIDFMYTLRSSFIPIFIFIDFVVIKFITEIVISQCFSSYPLIKEKHSDPSFNHTFPKNKLSFNMQHFLVKPLSSWSVIYGKSYNFPHIGILQRKKNVCFINHDHFEPI